MLRAVQRLGTLPCLKAYQHTLVIQALGNPGSSLYSCKLQQNSVVLLLLGVPLQYVFLAVVVVLLKVLLHFVRLCVLMKVRIRTGVFP